MYPVRPRPTRGAPAGRGRSTRSARPGRPGPGAPAGRVGAAVGSRRSRSALVAANTQASPSLVGMTPAAAPSRKSSGSPARNVADVPVDERSRPARRGGPAPTHRATVERRPSAPTTRSALASRCAAPARPVTPVTRPARSRRSPVTGPRPARPPRLSARHRPESRPAPCGAGHTAPRRRPGSDRTLVTRPADGTFDRTGGVPAPTTPSSTPHRDSWRTPARMSPWVDSVSLPNRDRSTTAPGRHAGRAVTRSRHLRRGRRR